MTRTIGIARAAGFVLALAGATACSDRTERKAEAAAESAAADAERTADNAGNAVADAAKDAGRAVENAATAAGNAVMEGGRAADAAVETMDVKVALTADTRVDASDINVDTDHNTKTVTLRGSVPSAAQKTLAGDIAIAKATGYRVVNSLTVRAK